MRGAPNFETSTGAQAHETTKKRAPKIGALSRRSWGKGAAQFASLRANAAPDRRIDGLVAVEEPRGLALLNGGSG